MTSVYSMLREDANSGISYNGMNWAYQIKTMLNKIGFSDIWNNQGNFDINYSVIKQRVLDIYKQTWYAAINNSSRLASYSHFKYEFKLEKYLSCITDKRYLIALSRLRTSSHDLAIETGRYTNIDRQYRICQHCNMGTIEDEYHFVLICPKFRDLRTRFFSPYYCRWPNLYKFTQLLSSESKKVINNVAKYTYFALKRRT